jgi:hypothetical protein
MRRGVVIVGMAQAALVGALVVGLVREWFPLGVRTEWEWLRHGRPFDAAGLTIAGVAAAAYLLVAVAGSILLRRRATRWRVGGWLAALLVSAVAMQAAVQTGAPTGYGLAKWATLGMPGPSDYYTVAVLLASDPAHFLERYPEWIAKQDSLHIGTHPPGLFLLAHAARRLTGAFPATAQAIDAGLPVGVKDAFRHLLGPISVIDRVALVLLGAMTLLACAATVVPLYALARRDLGPVEAWGVASLWPLVPAAILFQPTADTWYPLLATSALVLAARPSRGGVPSALAAGVVLAIGMQFSLVFLAVGLAVALTVAMEGGGPRSFGLRRRASTSPAPAASGSERATVRKLFVLAATGLGFFTTTLAIWAATRANPFAIWLANARNHARFYVQFHRTYWLWVLANPIETAVAIGLPCVVWGLIGLSRRGPAVSWATLLVLAILTFSGRNLSEVARLWLPFFPALLVACGRGMERLGAGPVGLGSTLMLLAAQTLALQALIQVVWPV